MKKILFAALAVAAAVACTSNRTVVCGTVPEGAEGQVMVQVRGAGIDTLLTPADGKFSADLPVDIMETGIVSFGGQYSQFILDGTRVTVDFGGDGEWVKPSGAKGANADLVKIMEWNDGFMQRYQAAATASEEEQDALIGEYTDKMKSLTKNDNAIGMLGLQELVGMLEPSEMRGVVDGLPKGLKATETAQKIIAGLETKEKTAVGQMFTDFEITQPDGSVKKLSDYVGRGKYILADFWASWCGPCRREIPNVKNVYAKFHGEQFDVVSIAVWDKVEDTLKAIEEEGLPWNQIIDCQKVPTDIYGIDGIPELILFGPDGTILARGGELRGAKMEPAIAEYVK